LGTQADVAVIGAGIVGLANAWAAARLGYSVVLFDRSTRAQGASIRNFGMIWPIGQTAATYPTALRSRELWLELAREAGIWHNPCGSVHLAHRDDEWQVLAEFAEVGRQHGYQCELWSKDKVLKACRAANPNGLLGALWSPTELCVNPREAVAALPRWLVSRFNVQVHFETPISRVDLPIVEAADGQQWRVDRVVICSGVDFQTLYPEKFAEAKLRTCKLQMLRTSAQPNEWRIGPLIAGGLTLRHYANFNICPSLNQVRQRIAAETPELDRFGIHGLISQNATGEVILGDSHEYDDEISPFDKPEIDDLMLRELRRMAVLPDWKIAERWHGIYAKHPTDPFWTAEPQPNVHLMTGTGGAGMTLSFGVADEVWRSWKATSAPKKDNEMSFSHRKSISDGIKLRAVIFDWAGTTVDYGSMAPVEVFMEVFRRQGVPITVEEAREPMGMSKRAHLEFIAKMPQVSSRWRETHGRNISTGDLDAMYAAFLPLQMETLADHALLIPGVLETIAVCRQRGMKIGSTTGYTRALMDALVPLAERQGYAPDAVICADDVPAGRPAPWLNFEAAKRLDVYPMRAIAIVDDTVEGIKAAVNAGAWAIGVAQTGNELGLPLEQFNALPQNERSERTARAKDRLLAAGADFVITSVAELIPVLEEITGQNG
jgi:phosphonoacetaldehyde hydrolase